MTLCVEQNNWPTFSSGIFADTQLSYDFYDLHAFVSSGPWEDLITSQMRHFIIRNWPVQRWSFDFWLYVFA